jgi:hypothetical protein
VDGILTVEDPELAVVLGNENVGTVVVTEIADG